MANQNSTLIENRDVQPSVRNVSGTDSARLSCSQNAFEVTAKAAADVIFLAYLNTNAVLEGLKLKSDSLGTALTVDIGLYDEKGNVVDADAFASAVDLSSATTEFTDYITEAADIALQGQRLWEFAGETEDPGGQYQIALTVVTSTTPVDGTLAFSIPHSLT